MFQTTNQQVFIGFPTNPEKKVGTSPQPRFLVDDMNETTAAQPSPGHATTTSHENVVNDTNIHVATTLWNIVGIVCW